ncbi:MAG TPA: VOC family protein, partial [Candidatus Limnocylindrales bacterium]|nr:VOC family protein [Candidatus Limnocylindrales bacterium]
ASLRDMDITISQTLLPHDDPDASLRFYRDTLGFEVRNDVAAKGMRWVTIGSPSQPNVNIVLEPPAADPGISPADREAIGDLLAKGVLRGLNFSTTDLEATFDRVQATGVDVVQEPMDQPWGVRDCAFRDPAGNLIRVSQSRG